MLIIVLIVTDNGFDALFAANRIVASVREKARTHPLRLAGLIGNRTAKRDLIDKYVEAMSNASFRSLTSN